MILTDNYVKSLIKPRERDCNKGDFGKLLCIVSCFDMTGAGIIAAKSAMRCGVGLCTVASAKSALIPLKIALPEATTLSLEENKKGAISRNNIDKLIDFSKGCTAALIGCGLSVCEDTEVLVKELIKNLNIPIILDADGINVAAKDINILRSCKAPLIITPHLKEMSRLCNKSVLEIKQNKTKTAQDFAKEYNCTVVLKDFETVIATADGSLFENLGGHAAMAKGGSGDMLAGMIAGFIASNMDITDAVCSGVFLHSRAGEICGNSLGDRCVLASDMIQAIPDAFNSLK